MSSKPKGKLWEMFPFNPILTCYISDLSTDANTLLVCWCVSCKCPLLHLP